MDWRKHIIEGFLAHVSDGYRVEPIFYPPASQDELDRVQKMLGIAFPNSLCELLLQTNGCGEYMTLTSGQIPGDLGRFILNLSDIVDVTTYHRKSDMSPNIPFGEIIFFGDTHVDGIRFAVGDTDTIIYAWYPIGCVFEQVGSGLPEFVFDLLSGKLSY